MVITSILPKHTLKSFYEITSKSSLHTVCGVSLDRHGCKLQLYWMAEAYKHEVVILVFMVLDPYWRLRVRASQPLVILF